ncbi:unnamed protein product, partial [Staurois parvus]
PPINANQCHLAVCCQSVPPISASHAPISACQCRLTVPVSAAYQCQSVPPISFQSVPPINAIYASISPSMMPVNAHQCHLPVPPYQCHLSVSISASY